MSVTGIHKILVDLVRDHEYAVPQTDLRHFLQFLFFPHASHRIVRTAKNEKFHIVFNDLALEIFEVNRIFLPVENQFIDDDLPVVVADAFLKTVIDRFLDQDPVSRLRETADQRAEGEDHARRADRGIRIDFPAVAG